MAGSIDADAADRIIAQWQRSVQITMLTREEYFEVAAYLHAPAGSCKKKVGGVAPAGLFLWFALELRDCLTHPTARIAHRAKAHTLRALRRVRYKLELVSHPAKFWKRTGLHLLHRPAAMHLHRGFGDADIVGNLFAQAAARHLNYDLALPRT